MHEHDAAYNTSFLYRGNLVSTVTPAGTKGFAYDIGGNVTTSNVNGVVSTVTTSSSTNYAAPSQLTTNTLSSNLNWYASLAISSAAGPNGDTASFGFDTNGRPTSTTSPTGAVTNYTYADTASPPNKTATTNTHWVQTSMDGFGRTIMTWNNSTAGGGSIVQTFYDPCGCSPLGKISKVSQPFAPNGTVYWTKYTYDASGRTTKVALPDSSATTYAYQGNTVTVTDPAGKTKTFTMDAFGNLTKVVETDPTLGQVSTNYTYDMLNHLITVSMPRGSNTQTRTFNYIPSGTTTVGAYLLSAINPENGTVSYTYNSNGTLASKTDAKGQVFTYSYDSYNRLHQVFVGGSLLRTFLYDTNTLDGSFTTSGYGRLVAVQNAQFTPGSSLPTEFTEMYSYTAAGQPSKKRLQVNVTSTTYPYPVFTNNLDAIYSYDTEGKMTAVQYPSTTSGPTYTYSFDTLSRPIGLTDRNNYAAVSGVQYGGANAPPTAMSSISYFGETETRQYNNLMQLTDLNIAGVANGLHYNYRFPTGTNNGKISSQYDYVSGETITYAYDSLNRLLSASGSGWNQSFGYDGFGNLTSKSGSNSPPLSVVVNASTNQIQGVSGLSYDFNGNELYGGVAYDAENRLLSAPGVQYAYDSQNKRVWKGTFSGSTLTAQEAYFYGVDGKKLGTYSLVLNGTYITSTNTYLAVFFRGKMVAMTQGGTLSAFIQDRVGSNGKYFPYGEDRNAPANDEVKFATYTRDSATGLDYADQRYYSNQFGRFMSPDRYWGSASLGNPQSWNRYTYASNDPINHLDPLGLCDDVISGIDSSSTDNSSAGFAESIGAMQTYPYAGTNLATGVGQVVTPDLEGWNAQTVAASINASANDSTGPINLFIFSGGAQAFADAIPLLSASVIARISSITYASPGMVGTPATVNGITPTVVLGAGVKDDIATAGTVIPVSWPTIHTQCGHDAACEFAAALAAGVKAGNACNQPRAISLLQNNAQIAAQLSGLSSLINAAVFNPFGYLNVMGFVPMPDISSVFSTITYPSVEPVGCVTTPGLNGGPPDTVCH